jgi:hypothetical protein
MKKPPKCFPKISDNEVLNGSVHATFARCGKPNCKCARGERHGPYYHRYRRVGDRILKEYIPLAKVKDVESACVRYKLRQAEIRSNNESYKSMLASLKLRIKEIGL